MLLPAGQRASGEWIDDTLRARAEEKGLLARTPLAGEFPRQRVELIRGADPTAEVNRLYRLRGWTDGLPIVPPTPERVATFVAASGLAPDTVLGGVPTREVVVTLEQVAINAVMAGCRPEYVPVVVAAVRAHLQEKGNCHSTTGTLSGAAQVVIVP